MGWSIKDSVSGLFPEGDYMFRLESIKADKTKNEKDPLPCLKWVWVNVTDGDENKGKKQFQTFTLRSDIMGILGSALAATQAFDENAELPDDAEGLSAALNETIVGQVFDISYSHRFDKKTKRTWPQIDIVGPAMSDYRNDNEDPNDPNDPEIG